jgi:hypothetical protein
MQLHGSSFKFQAAAAAAAHDVRTLAEQQTGNMKNMKLFRLFFKCHFVTKNNIPLLAPPNYYYNLSIDKAPQSKRIEQIDIVTGRGLVE